ncbi:MAG: alpha/beta hydrolase [Gemmataceae bacterium]
MSWRSHPGPGLAWLERGPDAADAPLVVWLHGFGANAADLTPLCGPPGPRRHALPEGPLGDGTARAWHERGGTEHPATVAATLARFDEWLAHLFTLYRPRRAALVGFSQGGAVALRVGLPRPDRFAGVAVLAGALRRVDDLTPTLPAGRAQRLFVGHGRADEVVPCDVARDLVAYLRQHGYAPHFQTYPVGHTVSPRQADDLGRWLDGALG